MKKVYFIKNIEKLEENDFLKRMGFEILGTGKLREKSVEEGFFIVVDIEEQNVKLLENEIPELKPVNKDLSRKVLDKLEEEENKETESLHGLFS